jgi:hypothetical protein
MGLIESELAEALHSPIKRRANRAWNLRAIAKRRTSGASEVMVKITGFGKGYMPRLHKTANASIEWQGGARPLH